MPRWSEATTLARGAQAITSAFRGLSALAGGGGEGTPVFDALTDVTTLNLTSDRVYGWSFTPSQDLEVTHFRAYRPSPGTFGTPQPLEVSLWRGSDEARLAGPTEIFGDEGQWSEPVALPEPVLLETGVSYAVGMHLEANITPARVNDFTLNELVSSISSVRGSDGAYDDFPDGSFSLLVGLADILIRPA